MIRKHREHHEEHIDESWLIPYADLLTLLLALFIVLFASSTIDEKKYNAMREAFNAAFQGGSGVLEYNSFTDNVIEQETVAAESMVEMIDLKKQIDQYIQDNNLSMALESKITNNSVTITILEYILFDSGKAVVRPESIKIFEAIAGILVLYPNNEVVVSGHTDNRPINTREFESNWDLSSKRALNCMKIILANQGIDPHRFSAIGYGEYKPVSNNDSAEGRAKNRRVEVIIYKSLTH